MSFLSAVMSVTLVTLNSCKVFHAFIYERLRIRMLVKFSFILQLCGESLFMYEEPVVKDHYKKTEE